MTEPCKHLNQCFDRSVCADPCGAMHTWCLDCPDRLDDCAHDVPPPAPVQPEPVAPWPPAFFGAGQRAQPWTHDLVEAEKRARMLRETDGAYHVGLPLILDELDRLRVDNAKYRADYLQIGATVGRQRDIVAAATAALTQLINADGEVREYIDGRVEQAIIALAEAVKGEAT
jgi:hypothetical protein